MEKREKKTKLAFVWILVSILILMALVAVLLAYDNKASNSEPIDFMKLKLEKYITLGDYESLSFDLSVKSVTEAEVEEAMDQFAISLHTYEDYVTAPPARATVENDYLQISYEGRIDGVLVDQSPSDSPQYLLLADGNGYYEWINDALIDVLPGDTVIAEGQLNNDETYGEHAGKTITYEITLVAILGHYTFVEMTDAIVMEKTGFPSIEAYREALPAILLAARQEEALSGLYKDAWEQAQELSEIKKYPKKQIEYYYNAFMGNYAYIAYQNGATLETVLAQYGVDEDRVMEMAEASCAEDLFYYALVKAHGLEVTDEEYESRVGELAANQSMTVEELEAEYGKEYIRDSMLYDEAILFVANAVNVNYVYVD